MAAEVVAEETMEKEDKMAEEKNLEVRKNTPSTQQSPLLHRQVQAFVTSLCYVRIIKFRCRYLLARERTPNRRIIISHILTFLNGQVFFTV